MSLLWLVNKRDEPPDEFDMDGDDCISGIFGSHCIHRIWICAFKKFIDCCNQ